MKQLIILFLALGLFACSQNSDPDKILVENNFDGLEGWGIEHPSVTSQRAFSGKYSLKVDPQLEFGLGFNKILGTLTNQKPKVLKIEFRAYIPSDAARARFVCGFADPATGKDTFRQDFNLVDKTKDYREWVKIVKRLELPDAVQLSDKFSCYLWRPESTTETVFIDDLKITLLE